MAEFTALFLIALFYVIPLNLLLYKFCESFAEYLLIAIPDPPFKFLLNISSVYLPPSIYTLIFAALFLILYFLCNAAFKNLDINKWNPKKYSKGQKSINLTARIIIILLIALQIYFKVIDIKIIILAVLCLFFIFKETNPQNTKKQLKEKVPKVNK